MCGSALAGLLRLRASSLALLGNFTENMGPMLVHTYDFAIVVPLRIEQLLTQRGGREADGGQNEAY